MQPVVCIVVQFVALISLIPVYQWSGCEPETKKRQTEHSSVSRAVSLKSQHKPNCLNTKEGQLERAGSVLHLLPVIAPAWLPALLKISAQIPFAPESITKKVWV